MCAKIIYKRFLIYFFRVLCAHLLLLIIYFFPKAAVAAKKGSEAWYQKVWCDGKGGQIEYMLKNNTRADCLTPEYAIEMDFAHKWYEAVGQSLFYAKKTKRKAGIVLILKSKKDVVFFTELKKTVDYFNLPITIWNIGPWE